MDAKKVVALVAIAVITTFVGLYAEGGEGVEQTLLSWSDPSLGFAIQYPSTWTRDAATSSALAFSGGDGSMSVDIVTSSAKDVEAFARAYQPLALKDYKPLSLAASTEVKKAWVLGFTASANSAVTGKRVDLRGDRYFLPYAPGKYAVITIISPKRLYDREGARDIALTFKVLSGGK